MARIEYSQDLPLSDTVYHKQYSNNFRTFKQIPVIYRGVSEDDHLNPNKHRRPSDTYRESAFLQVTRYLEENGEKQITINNLIDKINDYLDGTDFELYIFLCTYKRLIDQFRDQIIITELDGKSNVVTFRSTAEIIHQFYESPKQEDIVF